ncbi:uncharacterized protein EV422DRAFT_562615 [Fimicolochytrium jonesii]|uniref:uncharacterized protein n=1 Tax=Fimicolochytrium jonesii TaxID=1396493 RepID=UPI0022FF0828|nr:uncharacterized protein EV422DRAFT_562615 [Fimicolochytrium jonesii]KAI8826556.1 hypothetical protein EV422DRAFT_562615 [Fimicolochytrium jonesii]
MDGCSRATDCPKTEVNGVVWPATKSGEKGAAPCRVGYSGLRYALCKEDGTFSNYIDDSQCVALPQDCKDTSGLWTPVPDGTVQWASCPYAFTGKRSAKCVNGQFVIDQSQCIPKPTQCLDNGTFPTRGINYTATASCPAGYTGSLLGTCIDTGIWDTNTSGCVPMTCPSDGVFADTKVDMPVSAPCPTGYTGQQTSKCGTNLKVEPADRSKCVGSPRDCGTDVHDVLAMSESTLDFGHKTYRAKSDEST